jgi:hypothetical protein
MTATEGACVEAVLATLDEGDLAKFLANDKTTVSAVAPRLQSCGGSATPA